MSLRATTGTTTTASAIQLTDVSQAADINRRTARFHASSYTDQNQDVVSHLWNLMVEVAEPLREGPEKGGGGLLRSHIGGYTA